MTVIAPRVLTGGLVHTPIEAGPEDLDTCINVYDEHGALRKRMGQRPVRQVGSTVTNLYTGWGTTTEPTSVGTGAMLNTSVGASTKLYVGHSAVMRQVNVHMQSTFDAGTPAAYSALLGIMSNKESGRPLLAQYWNGSAWTDIEYALTYRPSYDSAYYSVWIAPFVGYDITSGNNPSAHVTNGKCLKMVIDPPSDWATKTINGQTLYWIRIAARPAGAASTTSWCSTLGSSSIATTTEQPILTLLYFNDRRGTRHEFIIQKQSAAYLAYILDGTTLTGSDGLVPDGSNQVSAATKTWAYYDSSTDRIIGYDGSRWFWAPATNNGEVYNLTADAVATDTAYQDIVGGLRQVIPGTAVACTHDDRIWTAIGQTVVYSSPGPYKDVWPNDNELFCADDVGNITAMVSVGGVLAIFKRNSIWVCQSDGSADGYQAYRLPGNVGCVAPRSLTVAGGVAFFLAEEGIYSFDGQEAKKLSRKIDGVISREWSSAPEAAVGVWYSKLNQYRLFYPSTGSSPNVLDSALYMSTNPDGNHSFWPQGKNEDDDWGFNATAVAVDDTAPIVRICTGDRFGCIWELDKGLYDGATPVTFHFKTHRVNLASSYKHLLRWATVAQPANTNQSWTLSVYPDGNTAAIQTVSANAAGEMAAAAFYDAIDTTSIASETAYTSGGTFAVNNEQQTQHPYSFESQGRFIQLEMSDSAAGVWQFSAVELDATKMGRLG